MMVEASGTAPESCTAILTKVFNSPTTLSNSAAAVNKFVQPKTVIRHRRNGAPSEASSSPAA